MTGKLDLQHVQADEIRGKGWKMIPWIGLAMMVSTRLACLTRRCRHSARRVSRLETGMWLVGCTYNWCWPHHELSRRAAKAQERKGEVLFTPAMASGLTDHVWSVRELLTFRVPPSPWVAPKRRGRPRTGILPRKKLGTARPRPFLRLRKGVLCPSTN